MRARVITIAWVCAVASSTAAWGQDPLVRKRDAKLESRFLQRSAWTTDYDEALREAKAADKIVFAYFTKSYSS